MTDHPITPPPELVEQWHALPRSLSLHDRTASYEAAYRAGADAELEACCDAVYSYEGSPIHGGTSEWLRTARRPKPPTLKERALQAWAAVESGTDDQTAMAVIRRALEQLDD